MWRGHLHVVWTFACGHHCVRGELECGDGDARRVDIQSTVLSTPPMPPMPVVIKAGWADAQLQALVDSGPGAMPLGQGAETFQRAVTVDGRAVYISPISSMPNTAANTQGVTARADAVDSGTSVSSQVEAGSHSPSASDSKPPSSYDQDELSKLTIHA